MPTAFVLMQVKMGSEKEVLRELMNVNGVEEAYALYGIYNVVAKVWAESPDELKEKVKWRLSRIGNVRGIMPLIVVEDLPEEIKLTGVKRRSSDVKICPNCHAEMPKDANYCGLCGYKML